MVRIGEVIVRELEASLGPHTARTALKSCAERVVRKRVEELSGADVEPLLEALRPMLRTLLGQGECEAVLAHLRQELA